MKKILPILLLVALIAVGAVFHKQILKFMSSSMTPIVNEVEVIETLNPMIAEAKRSSFYQAGDEIENDSGLPVEIKSKKMKARLMLMPKGKIKLNDTKTQSLEKSQFSLKSGKVKFKVKKLNKSENFRVKTPTSVAGVRGTTYSLSIEKDGSTTLRVPEGTVALFKLGDEANEKLIGSGEKISHSQAGFGKQMKMSREEIEKEESSFWSRDQLNQKENYYQQKLNRAWPGSAQKFRLFDYESAYLDLNGFPKVGSLFPLKDFPLTTLYLKDTNISSIVYIKKMSIHHLDLTNTKVLDFKPLADLPLSRLNLEGCQIKNLSPLKNLQLTHLYLGGTEIKDITPIGNSKLKLLTLWKTKITSIASIKGMPIEWLSLSHTAIDDLSALEDMNSLNALAIDHCKIKDLSPIKNLKIKQLILTPDALAPGWDKVVKSMKSLEVVARNEEELQKKQTVEEFWKKVNK